MKHAYTSRYQLKIVPKKKNILKEMLKYKYIYLLLLPGIIYYVIFKYIPIYGIQLAFKKFMINKGITGSAWIGLDNFKYLLIEPQFWLAFKNTLIISIMKTVLGFPIPIILAILINELKFNKYKKFLQTVYTFPHFLSWIVLSGIMLNFLSNTGAINNFLVMVGLDRIPFFTNKGSFRYLLVYSEVWKEAGWGTIIYMATIAGIDPSLYEAALIDGANRWHKIKYIVWPALKPIVILMFILNIGQIMSGGFMQVLNLYNPVVYEVGDILETYIYRISFQRAPDFGISTAVGLFVGVVNFVLLFSANKIAKWFGGNGIV